MTVLAIDAFCQDFIVLGLMKSPGKATISKLATPRKWDEREGYGASGATIVYNGNKLATFEVLIEMWDEIQATLDWPAFALVLAKAAPNIIPIALGIGHPLLNSPPYNVTSVIVEDVGGLEQDDYGLWSCVIKFKEFRKPIPALGAPLAAIPASAAPVPTAQDALDVAISAQDAENQALAARLGP